jgi:hypothetical protein
MRLDVVNGDDGRMVVVVLSRRNLLAALAKIDMPGSARTITSRNCWEDGELAPLSPAEAARRGVPQTILVLRSEDDMEHYARRTFPPGDMHAQTETFVHDHGGWSPRRG